MARVVCSVVFILFSVGWEVKAQSGPISKDAIPKAELNNLIQGKLYYPNYVQIKGSQYLLKDWQLGDLQIFDKVYQQLPLLYDVYTDDLILIDWQGKGYGFIKMIKDYVKYFTLDERRFVNAALSRYQDSNLENKYYEVLFEDEVALLCSRNTDLKIVNSKSSFTRKDKFYLIRGDQVFELSGKKSFFSAVEEQYKKQLLKFTRKKSTRFKRFGDKEWKELIVYFNDLLNQDKTIQ